MAEESPYTSPHPTSHNPKEETAAPHTTRHYLVPVSSTSHLLLDHTPTVTPLPSAAPPLLSDSTTQPFDSTTQPFDSATQPSCSATEPSYSASLLSETASASDPYSSPVYAEQASTGSEPPSRSRSEMVLQSTSQLYLHNTAQYKDQFEAEFKQLGRGKYGQVFEVQYDGGKTCAAKEYLNVEREEIVRLFAEWVGMGLQHENLVTYHKVHCILDSERAVLFMDHVKQSLPGVIEESRMHNPVTILLVLSGVACGLAFLHSKGIVHCDLIPPNVLLTVPQYTAKISDYGNSVVRPISSSIDCHRKDIFCHDYYPPELLEKDTYNSSFDVFSFGHLSLYVILRRHPYPIKSPNYKLDGVRMARTEVERREECIDEVRAQINSVNKSVLKPLLQWIMKCLRDEEDERPEITDFDAHMAP